MKVAKVTASSESLLDPEGAAWRSAAEEIVQLDPTPLVLQPSEYIQVKWADLKHGETPEVRVRALHNGEDIFFRLEWDDATDDSKPGTMSDFPDQAGVMFPIKDDAPISEMGLPDQPVNMWLWRADIETPRYVTATGRGQATRHAESPLKGRGLWRNGVWSVVIGRPFSVDLPADVVAPLAPGATHKCTFAVWQGSAKERAGLKAHGPLWQELEIER